MMPRQCTILVFLTAIFVSQIQPVFSGRRFGGIISGASDIKIGDFKIPVPDLNLRSSILGGGDFDLGEAVEEAEATISALLLEFESFTKWTSFRKSLDLLLEQLDEVAKRYVIDAEVEREFSILLSVLGTAHEIMGGLGAGGDVTAIDFTTLIDSISSAADSFAFLHGIVLKPSGTFVVEDDLTLVFLDLAEAFQRFSVSIVPATITSATGIFDILFNHSEGVSYPKIAGDLELSVASIRSILSLLDHFKLFAVADRVKVGLPPFPLFNTTGYFGDVGASAEVNVTGRVVLDLFGFDFLDGGIAATEVAIDSFKVLLGRLDGAAGVFGGRLSISYMIESFHRTLADLVASPADVSAWLDVFIAVDGLRDGLDILDGAYSFTEIQKIAVDRLSVAVDGLFGLLRPVETGSGGLAIEIARFTDLVREIGVAIEGMDGIGSFFPVGDLGSSVGAALSIDFAAFIDAMTSFELGISSWLPELEIVRRFGGVGSLFHVLKEDGDDFGIALNLLDVFEVDITLRIRKALDAVLSARGGTVAIEGKLAALLATITAPLSLLDVTDLDAHLTGLIVAINSAASAVASLDVLADFFSFRLACPLAVGGDLGTRTGGGLSEMGSELMSRFSVLTASIGLTGIAVGEPHPDACRRIAGLPVAMLNSLRIQIDSLLDGGAALRILLNPAAYIDLAVSFDLVEKLLGDIEKSPSDIGLWVELGVTIDAILEKLLFIRRFFVIPAVVLGSLDKTIEITASLAHILSVPRALIASVADLEVFFDLAARLGDIIPSLTGIVFVPLSGLTTIGSVTFTVPAFTLTSLPSLLIDFGKSFLPRLAIVREIELSLARVASLTAVVDKVRGLVALPELSLDISILKDAETALDSTLTAIRSLVTNFDVTLGLILGKVEGSGALSALGLLRGCILPGGDFLDGDRLAAIRPDEILMNAVRVFSEGLLSFPRLFGEGKLRLGELAADGEWVAALTAHTTRLIEAVEGLDMTLFVDSAAAEELLASLKDELNSLLEVLGEFGSGDVDLEKLGDVIASVGAVLKDLDGMEMIPKDLGDGISFPGSFEFSFGAASRLLSSFSLVIERRLIGGLFPHSATESPPTYMP